MDLHSDERVSLKLLDDTGPNWRYLSRSVSGLKL